MLFPIIKKNVNGVFNMAFIGLQNMSVIIFRNWYFKMKMEKLVQLRIIKSDKNNKNVICSAKLFS